MELRVIDTGPGEAGANMDRDREIVREIACEVGAGPGFAVLRWYSWEPPAFSLGYAQKPESVLDLEAVRRLGIPWAKRPTGGSLVYHDGDQSYSFTVPRENPWGIVSSRDLYRFVSEAWIEGLGSLGIAAEMPESTPRFRDVPDAARRLCLAFQSPGDLVAGGRKFGGSAQRRMREVWLQEGFFLLRPATVPDCLAEPGMRSMMEESSADLAACGHPVDTADLREALTAAMRRRCAAGPVEEKGDSPP